MLETSHPPVRVQSLGVEADGTALVHDVTFSIAAGERVALLGRSGSGKSLTVSAIAGSLPPWLHATGTVATDGPVALVQQDSLFALNPLVSVGRQLDRPARARGVGKREARQESLALLTEMGFEKSEAIHARLPGELSGGQRQRICIAMGIACRAGLLIADEATTALDVVTQQQVIDALGRAEGALLFVTHDLAVAAELCERVLVMHQGRLIDDLSTRALLDGAGSEHTRRLVDAGTEHDDSSLVGP